MLRRIARYSIILALVVVGLALVLDVLYFARGSLEMLPTAEDHEKVRLVTGVLGVILASAGLGLWLLLRYLRREGDAGGG